MSQHLSNKWTVSGSAAKIFGMEPERSVYRLAPAKEAVVIPLNVPLFRRTSPADLEVVRKDLSGIILCFWLQAHILKMDLPFYCK